MAIQQNAHHSIQSTNIADLLERILDKGIVIAGDIKISLVDVELLTIQLRLVICSVDKAREMGMDWWVNNPCFSRGAKNDQVVESLARIEQRLERLETPLTKEPGSYQASG
ncbi:MAG: gas vesicle protein [Pseudomonadota bacterium]